MTITKLAKNIIFIALLANNLASGMSGFNEPRHLPMIPTWINRWWSGLNLPSARTQDPELIATLDSIRQQRATQNQFLAVLPQLESTLQSGEPTLVRTIAERLFLREISLSQLNENLSVSPYAIRLRITNNTVRTGMDQPARRSISSYELYLIGKKFPNLRELDLSGTGLSDETLIALVLQPYASRLTHLNISNNPVRLAHRAIVGYRSAFPSLVSLDISNTPIADRGLLVIARQPFAYNLSYLNISATRITLNSRTWRITDITDAEIKASINIFKKLKQLNISNNRIGNAGLALLAQAPFAPELTSLDISNTQLTTEGVVDNIHVFTELTSLDVSANAIGDRGLEVIANQSFAPNLTLYLGRTDVTPVEISKNQPRFRRILIKAENKTA